MRPLVVAALAVVALWILDDVIPFVGVVDAPLMWLATTAHELGHGLAGLAVGCRFESYELHWGGSGVARTVGPRTPVGSAVIAAGGLVGPAVLAALLFVVGTRARPSRIALGALGTGLLAAAALVVGNAFGLVFTIAAGLALVAAAWKLSAERAQLVVLFVAIQLALSVFSSADYLFTDVARTAAGDLPSDTAAIAAALGGVYWAWGVAVGALSVVVLVAGLGFVWLVGARKTNAPA